MNQELIFKTTNYLSPYLFYNKFLFWLVRLQPFVATSGKPPVDANTFVNAMRIQYGCGLRVSEGLNLIKSDFDLNHRMLTIRMPKTGRKRKFRSDGTIIESMIAQKTTILPYDIPVIEKHLAGLSKNDIVFPINRHFVWEYAKDAGRLAGLNISEIQKTKVIDGVWTHLMRKSCSKRMAELGASRELRMKKLRHAFRDAHDAYDTIDYNALLEWEDKQFGSRQMVTKEMST